MPRIILILLAALLLTACSLRLPDFVGREGGGSDDYSFSGDDPLPDPVPVPVTSTTLEPALRGVILRAEGLAPSQGYWGASLTRIAPPPGTSGSVRDTIDVLFLATPPATPQPVGAPQTRILRAALFLPVRDLRRVENIRLHSGPNSTLLPLD